MRVFGVALKSVGLDEDQQVVAEDEPACGEDDDDDDGEFDDDGDDVDVVEVGTGNNDGFSPMLLTSARSAHQCSKSNATNPFRCG